MLGRLLHFSFKIPWMKFSINYLFRDIINNYSYKL